jgi:5-formyltetrahydrofolate cyclo-ligase
VDKALEKAKNDQRKAAIQRRNGLSALVAAEMSLLICEKLKIHPAYCNSQMIFSYMAFRNEADLSSLHLHAITEGKSIAYPVCLEEGQMVAALPIGEDAWAVGKFGIMSPRLDRSKIVEPEALELVLVPCTAFDPNKRMRTGWGAGFYDRYLRKCTSAAKIAVAFELQKVEPLAFNPDWDVQMDAIATEERFY